MAEAPDTGEIYYIPENFIGESRIWQGRIRTRYLIDSVILGLLGGIIGIVLLFTVMANADISAKITVAVITLAPGILLGQLGYNGDPISVAFMNFLSWRKNNQIRLFNTNMRLLGTDPVKAISEMETGKDKLVSKYQSWIEKKREEKESQEYVEGETFEFEEDPDMEAYTEENGDYDDESEGGFTDSVNRVEISSGSDLDALDELFGSFDDDEEEEL